MERVRITEPTYTLEEAFVYSDGETLWCITDPKTGECCYIKVNPHGALYAMFFKRSYIAWAGLQSALSKMCRILMERNLKPTINIHYTNQTLIKLFVSIGFRKAKNVKALYYLRKLKDLG